MVTTWAPYHCPNCDENDGLIGPGLDNQFACGHCGYADPKLNPDHEDNSLCDNRFEETDDEQSK